MTQPTTALDPQTTTGRLLINVIIDGVNMGARDNYKDAAALRDEILAARAAAPAPLQPRRRKAPRGTIAPKAAAAPKAEKNVCTCPACQRNDAADGIYYCKADKQHLAYHGSEHGPVLIRGGDYLTVVEALNNHRYELLRRPLPGAAAEDVADILAAEKLAA